MEEMVVDFLHRAEQICKCELMTSRELIEKLDIAHNTLMRIRRYPGTCSLRTIKKLKKFVEEWEAKNKSHL